MLIWFRNDLRVNDNPALQYFLENVNEREVADAKRLYKAIFFVSEKQWEEHHWSPIKIDFIKRHAVLLAKELTALNIELEIVSVADFSAQLSYLKEYCNNNNIARVIANSELETNEKKRDIACLEQGIPLKLFESDVIVPKGRILNQSGDMYKVFTPFKKTWLKHVKEHGFEYLGNGELKYPNPSKLLANTRFPNLKCVNAISSNWPLVTTIEKDIIPHFIQHKLHLYKELRDTPSIKGTSGLSPYLAIGAISPRYLLRVLLNKCPDLLIAEDSAEFSWLNELIWREFYRNLLFHFPTLCKHQCFKEKYQQTVWPNHLPYFKAWCEGKTGYPLVDAAMRQLNQTGWMHNRLRMVVASFLTKHLLIDWRWGEKYFMEHLIDGDLAANNGGWQWAASTGCDAQPYFRVFNPTRQSEKFDPKGDFIRKYIPELKQVPDKAIHSPQKYIEKHNLAIYWPTIVDHKDARALALNFYK